MTEHDTLYEALTAAMIDMPRLDKGTRGAQFNYRSIDDVMAAVRPHLLEHGLAPIVSFGSPISIGDDPWSIEVPVTVKLVHGHSGDSETLNSVGWARVAGKEGTAVRDPRVIGQAVSYAVKTLFVAQFMLAGGDDSVDQDQSDRSAPAPPPPNPALEQDRKDLLDLIGSLPPEMQQTLATTLRAAGLSVKRGNSEELIRILGIVNEIDDKATEEEIAAWLPERSGAPKATDNPPEAPAAAVGPPVAPQEANVDVDESADNDEESVEDAELPHPKARYRPAPIPEPKLVSDVIDDQQLAYLIGSNGRAASAKTLGTEDMTALKTCLSLIRGLKSGALIAKGLKLVNADGEVEHDGTEAVARYLSTRS